MILIIGGAFQGKGDFAQNTLGIDEGKIFFDFHTAVKKLISSGKTAEELVKELIKSNYAAVISDEVGCGIVPIDRAERDYREAVGRALCTLAAGCDEVWRVQCGIGIKIKG